MPRLLPADPRACVLAHRAEIAAAIDGVLEAGGYVLGRNVTAFEEAFGAFAGGLHCVGVASGTDALVLALRGAGIGAGDQVFTVSHTAVATVAAIELAGALPVLVDIDPRTYALDPQRLDDSVRRLGRGARRAVVAVHLYGHPADMPAICEVARRHELVVIEDCAQAHGATLGGRPVGSFGAAAAYSFYPTKNLGALGDAGAVVSGDAGLADRVRSLREYGWRQRYVSELTGMNSRLDEIQAAVLRVKLRHLPAENARRCQIAAGYAAGLSRSALELPQAQPGVGHVWHQYVVRSARRDALREALRRQEIDTLVHYPVPIHLQAAYRGRLAIDPAGLERSEAAAAAVLSLPMHAHMVDADIERVVAAIGALAEVG